MPVGPSADTCTAAAAGGGADVNTGRTPMASAAATMVVRRPRRPSVRDPPM
ncbi:MAG: hypothetical protein ACLP2J_08140 [Acidimicrobiales bacterium]